MFPALFIILPLVELLVLFAVESRIGWPASLITIVVTGIVGAIVVRRQGRAAWRAVLDAFGRGVLPGAEMAHAGLVLVGGAFLLTPGFITDAAGFLLMVPAVRELVRLRLGEATRRRVLP